MLSALRTCFYEHSRKLKHFVVNFVDIFAVYLRLKKKRPFFNMLRFWSIHTMGGPPLNFSANLEGGRHSLNEKKIWKKGGIFFLSTQAKLAPATLCRSDLSSRHFLHSAHVTTTQSAWLIKYTQRNLFGILLNQLEIRLYLPFSVWFETKRSSVWFHTISFGLVNTIWFQVSLIRFRKDFSVCKDYCTFLTLKQHVRVAPGYPYFVDNMIIQYNYTLPYNMIIHR